ncbi:hypothetical protein ACQ4PT_006077 [Festuca glaucescens]
MALAGIVAVTRALAVSAAVTMALAVEQVSMVMVLPSMDHRGSMLVEEEVSPLPGKETSSLERPVARPVTHTTMGTGNTPMRSSELILGSSTEAPKPSVTMYGYAIEQLMFFEIPAGGAYKPKVDNVKLVKVTVEGDPMSIPEIAECLRRIVPVENFQWEIYNFQNNVFRVKFPNKFEAQRMKAFRTYPVPDRASDLIFEDWSALEDPLYMLPEVWLRVRGIPADVRTDFLSLWAVGTLFGKTKEVDMVHTRKRTCFEVEQVTVTQLGTDDMGNNGDNNGGGGNNGANGDNVDGAKDMDIERTMNNDQQGNANNQQGTVKKVNNAKSVVAHQVQHLVEVPMVFGSLNKALLNKGNISAGTPSHADAAPGSVLIRPVAASGSETPGAAGDKLLLGSYASRGASPLGAETRPATLPPWEAALSPRAQRSLSPGPPAALWPLSAAVNAAAAAADTAPAGEPRLAADHPSTALSAAVTVAAAAADTPPAGERRLAADQPCTDPKLKTPATGQTAACRAPLGDRGVAVVLLGGDPAVVALAQPASPAPTQRKLTPVGPAIDAVGQQVLALFLV